MPKNQSAHDEEFLPDELYEEQRIMEERAQPPRTLGSHTLRVPISTLGLGKPVAVTANATIHDAIEAMQKGRFGAVLVTGGDGKVAGIFTERDVLMKLAGKGKDWKAERVDAWMTAKPETLPVDASLAFALNMMTEGGYRHVPLVDADQKPVAVLSMKDVVRYICSFFEKEVKNLPPRPNLVDPTKKEGG